MVGIIQFLPSLLLVLVTGVIADRFGRRLIAGLAAILEGGLRPSPSCSCPGTA